MKRFTLAIAALTLLSSATVPTIAEANFNNPTRDSVSKNASYDELRRGHQEGIKAVDFDKLRRENLDKDAVDFDELRRENLEKDAVSIAVLS